MLAQFLREQINLQFHHSEERKKWIIKLIGETYRIGGRREERQFHSILYRTFAQKEINGGLRIQGTSIVKYPFETEKEFRSFLL